MQWALHDHIHASIAFIIVLPFIHPRYFTMAGFNIDNQNSESLSSFYEQSGTMKPESVPHVPFLTSIFPKLETSLQSAQASSAA